MVCAAVQLKPGSCSYLEGCLGGGKTQPVMNEWGMGSPFCAETPCRQACVCVSELVLAVAATPPKRNQVLGAAPILCSGVPKQLGAMCWCSSAWELWFAHTSPGLGWYQDLQIPAGIALRPR